MTIEPLNEQSAQVGELSASYYVKVEALYPAPDEPEAFKAWCGVHGFRYLGEESGRRAWCSDFATYLRDATGVAELSSGDRFLYRAEDLVRADALEMARREDER